MIKRRLFVQGTAACATAAATGLHIGCGPQVQPAPYIEASLTADNRLRVSKLHPEFDLLSPTAIENRGGAITVIITGPRPANVPEAVLLVHRKDGVGSDLEWVAMSSACPHLGCPLGWAAGTPKSSRTPVGMVKCPCHQSQFTVQSPFESDAGECISVEHAPAMAPPTLLPVDTRDGDFCLIGFELAAGTVDAAFKDHPALAQIGGAAVVMTGGCGGVVVVRTGAMTAEAYTATCTHLACTVALNGNELVCPCHSSRYDFKGQVLEGPAQLPLKAFVAKVEADKIVVTIS